jgi:hypothetical protein
VWQELHALGSLADAPAALLRDVDAVALRTMERAARNLETIHARLVAMEFVFDSPDRALLSPNAEYAAVEAILREKIGSVPASLHAWFAHVGEACFRGWLPSSGSAPAWYAQLVDPFEFGVGLEMVEGDIEMFEDDAEAGEPFGLSIAGDYLHKNDFSGGAPTVILLPSDHADAFVVEDDGAWFRAYTAKVKELGDRRAAEAAVPQTPDVPIWFVDYLRMYFAAGGFRRVSGTQSYPQEFARRLAADLLEI